MSDILTSFNTRTTSQRQRADNRQVQNNAGGFVFEVDDLTHLRRFLTLGTDGGTYYTNAGDLTRDNAEVVVRLANTNHKALVDTVVDMSVRGGAPKVNPTIFALALAASVGAADEKSYALSQLSKVCRTGTHLFIFARYIEQFRGWGRGLRRAVAQWYLEKETEDMAFQAVKYRQREGWSHRDLLRLAHPSTLDPARRATFDWICRTTYGDEVPAIIDAFRRVHTPGADVAKLVRETELTWEMLPSDALNDPKVWDALLDRGMPQTALMRQLPRLTRLGLLPQMGGRTKEVVNQLTNTDRLIRARVHPVNVLIAQRTYASGTSVQGSSTWAPTGKIVDALDAAFYEAFGAVEPANKRTMLALDVSGSMDFRQISGLPLTPREASAALALVQMATEPEVAVTGFTSVTKNRSHMGITPLSISPRQRLEDVLRTVKKLSYGGTDCSLPMRYAADQGLEVDTFVVYTDNETWAGRIHPHQALTQYRMRMGIDAKLIVVGMTATNFSIADPSDLGMLDVAGFDVAVPNLITGFSRGL